MAILSSRLSLLPHAPFAVSLSRPESIILLQSATTHRWLKVITEEPLDSITVQATMEDILGQLKPHNSRKQSQTSSSSFSHCLIELVLNGSERRRLQLPSLALASDVAKHIILLPASEGK